MHFLRLIITPENRIKNTLLLIRIVNHVFIEVDTRAAFRTELCISPHLVPAAGTTDERLHLDEALLIQFVKRVHITVIRFPGVHLNVFFMLVKEQLHRTVPHVLQGNVKIFFPFVPVNHVMLFIPFIHINADIVQAIKNQLNAECAGGGGDEPEAVAEALNDAFSADTWASDSVKVAFLIYDAPPHAEKSAEIVQAIETAADKGIHLVPVVSSNGSRETELFGRAAAICTNGDYVFLTDDSGIGGSHLEPIIGDYEVQPLHDVIVQIVNDYRQK